MKMMIGKFLTTSSGFDPELGQHVKDPFPGLIQAWVLAGCVPTDVEIGRVGAAV